MRKSEFCNYNVSQTINLLRGGHPSRRVPSAANTIGTPRQDMKKVFDRATLPKGTIILEPPEMDKCIVGLRDKKLVYSYMKLIDYFSIDEGMHLDEIDEWIGYNIEGLNVVTIDYPFQRDE